MANHCCVSGSGGDDLLLPDPRLGGAYRHGGEQAPEASPARVLRLQRQLQRGVDAQQPEDHRQHPSSAQVRRTPSLTLPPGNAATFQRNFQNAAVLHTHLNPS